MASTMEEVGASSSHVSASGHNISRLQKSTAVLAKKLELVQHNLARHKNQERNLSIKQRFVVGGGTEPPFTGRFSNGSKYSIKRRGTFNCVVCDLPAYSSSSKFKSGTGWPSFYEPIDPDHVWETTDLSHGMVRKEVKCVRCHAHQGHVFNDGPRPTGKRYCVNAASLTFRAGDGEPDQGPSRGIAAGLADTLSKLLLRRKTNMKKQEEPSGASTLTSKTTMTTTAAA